MQFYIASASSDTSVSWTPYLQQLADALEFQLYSHVAPFWQGGGAKVSFVTDYKNIPDDGDVCPIVCFDDPDQPGALGWHTYDPVGREYGSVFWRPIKENGGDLSSNADSLSTVFSHEVIEAFCDPYTNDLSFVNQTTLEWKEACDRTQGDWYPVANLAMSNFLGPRAFRDGPGPFDWLRLLNSAWEVRPAGYVSRLNLTTGKVDTTFGAQMKEWKKKLVEHKLQNKLGRIARRAEKYLKAA